MVLLLGALGAAVDVVGHWPAKRRPTSLDLARHRIKQIAFWGDRLREPLRSRVGTAPPDLIEFLEMDNEVNHFPAHPQAVALPPDLQADITSVMDGLPAKLKSLLDQKLLGVFVVKGLGSSAYTDYVRDQGSHPAYAFVVLDIENMGRTANAWLTWKENSPFTPDPHWRLDATLEAPAGDTRRNALEFVMTHEFGHAVAFHSDIHPLWSLPPSAVDLDDYPFMSLAWEEKAGRWARRIDDSAPMPGSIVYYKENLDRPNASQLPAFYDWLAKTDFPTLYGATNPYDDFAESLVTYVHTVLLGKPFELRIMHDGVVERTVHACWSEPRCAAKRKILEDFLR